MVEQLAADYPDRFAPVTMHVNDDGYDLPWGQSRLDAFYGIPGVVPTFMVDALWNCQSADYRYYVEQQLYQPTDVTLELTANPVGGSTWDVTARVCLVGGSARPIRVFTAATLDNHPSLPRHTTNVLMQNVTESDINPSANGCENVTSRITFDSLSMSQTSDIVVIAWAQMPTTSAPTTVYQAGIMRWPFPAGSHLTTIDVAPANETVAIGEQIVYTAIGKDESGQPYPLENPTWSLGDVGSGGGTFDPGVGSATTTFTATTAGSRQVFCKEGGVTGGAIVTVTETPHLASIEIDPSAVTVGVDGQVALLATGKDQFGTDFPLTDPEWSVSGAGDGTFDPATGATTTFTASYPGSAVVTCAQGDVSGIAEVEITGDDPHLATIELSPATAQTRVGDELDFAAAGSDQYGRVFELVDPTWRIEGDGDGHFDPLSGSTATTFTATAMGTAQVICADNGIEGTATIEIASRGLPAPRKAKGRVAP